jgi:murein DD-endopeptidase MepM/ murein hydrolase activator NlpD
VIGLVLAGAWTLRRHRAPAPRSISYAWPEARDKPAPLEPMYFGPAWPPTDADWMFAFDRATWLYPLPGPARRAPEADGRIFSVAAQRKGGGAGAVCRAAGLCGVELGGELWGEHVYAVQEGVVDHAYASGSDEAGGGYVRIAHFGGMVFTQYFHLAAIPRGIVRGAHVSAGEVIGLLGDTGVGGEGPRTRAHLHFALSILPRSDLQETYWDPTPLMARWPLRVPPHGTVAGLVAATDDMQTPRRHRAR